MHIHKITYRYWPFTAPMRGNSCIIHKGVIVWVRVPENMCVIGPYVNGDWYKPHPLVATVAVRFGLKIKSSTGIDRLKIKSSRTG